MHTVTSPVQLLHNPTAKGRLRQLLPGLALTGALAFASIQLGKIGWLQANGISALTLAIVLGMGVGNTVYPFVMAHQPSAAGFRIVNVAGSGFPKALLDNPQSAQVRIQGVERGSLSLRNAGAAEVVPEAIEGSLMLASHALALVGVPPVQVRGDPRPASSWASSVSWPGSDTCTGSAPCP